MSDTTTPAAPSTDPLVSTGTDLVKTIDLIRSLTKDPQGRTFVQSLMANSGAVIAQAKADIDDIRADIPVVKAGWQTSEFWKGVAGVVVLVGWRAVTGQNPPPEIVAAIAAIVTVYTAVRGLVKAKAATA